MQLKNAEDPVKSSAAPNSTSPEDLFTLDDKDNFERERMINLLSAESDTETKTAASVKRTSWCFKLKLESSRTAQDPARAGIVNLANTE